MYKKIIFIILICVSIFSTNISYCNTGVFGSPVSDSSLSSIVPLISSFLDGSYKYFIRFRIGEDLFLTVYSQSDMYFDDVGIYIKEATRSCYSTSSSSSVGYSYSYNSTGLSKFYIYKHSDSNLNYQSYSTNIDNAFFHNNYDSEPEPQEVYTSETLKKFSNYDNSLGVKKTIETYSVFSDVETIPYYAFQIRNVTNDNLLLNDILVIDKDNLNDVDYNNLTFSYDSETNILTPSKAVSYSLIRTNVSGDNVIKTDYESSNSIDFSRIDSVQTFYEENIFDYKPLPFDVDEDNISRVPKNYIVPLEDFMNDREVPSLYQIYAYDSDTHTVDVMFIYPYLPTENSWVWKRRTNDKNNYDSFGDSLYKYTEIWDDYYTVGLDTQTDATKIVITVPVLFHEDTHIPLINPTYSKKLYDVNEDLTLTLPSVLSDKYEKFFIRKSHEKSGDEYFPFQGPLPEPKPDPEPNPDPEPPYTGTFSPIINALGTISTPLRAVSSAVVSIKENFSSFSSKIDTVVSYLNPLDSNFFLKVALVPSDGYFQKYFSDIKNSFESKINILELEDFFSELNNSKSETIEFYVDLPSDFGGRVEIIDFSIWRAYRSPVLNFMRAVLWFGFLIKTYKGLPSLIQGGR